MKNTAPDYKKIFSDIISIKFPDQKTKYKEILNQYQNEMAVRDVISLNDLIFGIKNRETEIFNQKLRAYNENDISFILDYQAKNNLNNSQTALHFKLSRNTLVKWRKFYN